MCVCVCYYCRCCICIQISFSYLLFCLAALSFVFYMFLVAIIQFLYLLCSRTKLCGASERVTRCTFYLLGQFYYEIGTSFDFISRFSYTASYEGTTNICAISVEYHTQTYCDISISFIVFFPTCKCVFIVSPVFISLTRFFRRKSRKKHTEFISNVILSTQMKIIPLANIFIFKEAGRKRNAQRTLYV